MLPPDVAAAVEDLKRWDGLDDEVHRLLVNERVDRNALEEQKLATWRQGVPDVMETFTDESGEVLEGRSMGVEIGYDHRGNKTIPIDKRTGLPVKAWSDRLGKLVDDMMGDPEKYEPMVESGEIHPDDYQRIAIEKNPTPPAPEPDKSVAGRLEKIAKAREARKTRPRTSPSTMMGLGLGGVATAAYLTEAAARGGPKEAAKAGAIEAAGGATIGGGFKLIQHYAPKAAATIGKGATKLIGPAGIPLTLVEMARATRSLGGWAGGYEATEEGVRLKRNKVSDRYLRTHKLALLGEIDERICEET
jgi:hypothetical protein